MKSVIAFSMIVFGFFTNSAFAGGFGGGGAWEQNAINCFEQGQTIKSLSVALINGEKPLLRYSEYINDAETFETTFIDSVTASTLQSQITGSLIQIAGDGGIAVILSAQDVLAKDRIDVKIQLNNQAINLKKCAVDTNALRTLLNQTL